MATTSAETSSGEEQSGVVAETRDGRDSKFFTCPNGHPYSAARCGWPMEVVRCGCGELIGGHDHKLLSTNWRINKADYDLLLARLGEGVCIDMLFPNVSRVPVPEKNTISPDQFDPTASGSDGAVPLKIQKVIAMTSDGIGHTLLPFSLPARNSAAEIPGPGRERLMECRRKCILCFGDSLTEGLSNWDQPFSPYSKTLENIMASRAEGETPYLVVNAGVCGETTREMCERLRRILHEYDGLLEIVLVLGGTNDLPESPAWITCGNIVQLHRMSHAAGARSVALTVPDCASMGAGSDMIRYEEKLREINQEIRAFARENAESVLLADIAAAFPQDAEHAAFWDSDRVHFSSEGYEAVGTFLAELLLASPDENVDGSFTAAEEARPISRGEDLV